MDAREYMERGIGIAPSPLQDPFALEWRQQCHTWAWRVFGRFYESHYSRAEMYYKRGCQLQWMRRHGLDVVGKLRIETLQREVDERRAELHELHNEVCSMTYYRRLEEAENDNRS